MQEQCYWIEVNFPLFGFWGTDFKLWGKSKRTAKKLFPKIRFYIFKLTRKSRIREPT